MPITEHTISPQARAVEYPLLLLLLTQPRGSFVATEWAVHLLKPLPFPLTDTSSLMGYTVIVVFLTSIFRCDESLEPCAWDFSTKPANDEFFMDEIELRCSNPKAFHQYLTY
jgi:hypothetical protein